MLERDEYGYVLKIVSNFPYHPWWRLNVAVGGGVSRQKEDRSGLFGGSLLAEIWPRVI